MPRTLTDLHARDKQFISCTHCRNRKVKCPGERPACSNCDKKGLSCHYDAVRKRRGPDKEPGGRLRPRGTFVNLSVGPITPTNPTIPPPELDQRRVVESWWSLLFEYLPQDQVVEHCRQFLEDSAAWINFFHRGRFFQSLFSRSLAPHVVFGILAHTTFRRDGKTRIGQLRALHFAEEGRKMLTHSLQTPTPDMSLVQTSLLLAAFEFMPHIHQNIARATAALGYMETCVKACRKVWGCVNVISQEEISRMCWVLSLLAAKSTLWRHLSEQRVLALPTADPTQFSTLFPIDLGRAKHGSSWHLYHQAICLWYVAVTHTLDEDTRAKVVSEARAIVDQSPKNAPNTWLAREWALAALGHLGELNATQVREWFVSQDDMVRQSSSDPNSWCLLMIAFTALQMPDVAGNHGDVLMARVFDALDKVVLEWPCSTLEHQIAVLKRRYNASQVRMARSASSPSSGRRPRSGT